MNKKVLWLIGGVSFVLLSIFVVSALLIFSLLLSGYSDNLESHGDIAYIEIVGPIMDSKEIVSQLDKVGKNKHIRGLLLRIDSPGGGVGASQEIYEAVLRVRQKKKVVASMGGVAASGGYYIAIAADKIVANSGTITGSIGVLMDHANVGELLKFLKIDANILTAGKNKDIGSPLRPLSEDDRQLLQSVLDDLHSQFKAAVKKQRKLSDTEIEQVADGRIFTGRQAQKLKLIDQLGNQQAAIDVLKDLANIEGEPDIVHPKKKTLNMLDLLLASDLENKLTTLFYTFRENRLLYMSEGLLL